MAVQILHRPHSLCRCFGYAPNSASSSFEGDIAAQVGEFFERIKNEATIGAAQLVSSNVAEDDAPAYAADTDYAVGARVTYESNVYESVQTPNLGKTPGEQPLYWALSGPTNRWAMFDDEVSTQTVRESPLVVVVKPGLVNSLALLELEGSKIEVTGRDGADGPIIYTAERSLEASIVTNWYEYFFEPFAPLSEIVFTDIPAYGSLHLEVSIEAPFGSVACGAFIAGTAYLIGDGEYGGSAGIL